MAAVGIDIGGSSIKVALLQPPGTPLTARSSRYARPGAPELVSALSTAIDQLGPAARAAQAIGLCVPGIVDPATSAVQASVNLPGLIGVPLRELVGQALGTPPARIEIASDARAAAHDWWTNNRHFSPGRALALSLGTGVGACVLDDGAPLRVTGPSSGHIGQMDVSINDEPPIGPDGGGGSLEAYIGLPALLARGTAEADAIIDRLTLADPALRALVRALRIAHAIYRPNHVVLMGGVGIRLAHRAAALREAVCENLTSLARQDWTLNFGTSEFHAAIGAAQLATDTAVPGSRA
jgi:predicted NBD/HSP70 family sugar kinase